MNIDINYLLNEAKKCYFEREELEEAIIYIETIFQMDPFNKDALLLIIEIYAEGFGNMDLVGKYSKIAYENYSNDFDIIVLLASYYRFIGKSKRALEFYEKSLDVCEDFTKFLIYIEMASCCLDIKYNKKALNYAKKAYKYNSLAMNTNICLAKCYQGLGNIEKSLEIFYEILEKKDNIHGYLEFLIYFYIAQTYYKLGNVEKAIENYYISINSEDILKNNVIKEMEDLDITVIYESFFIMLLKENNFKELELLILNIKNSNLPRYFKLEKERLYAYKLEEYDKVINLTEKLIDIDPENEENYNHLLMLCEEKNKCNDVLKIFEKYKKNIKNKKIIKKLENITKDRI